MSIESVREYVRQRRNFQGNLDPENIHGILFDPAKSNQTMLTMSDLEELLEIADRFSTEQTDVAVCGPQDFEPLYLEYGTTVEMYYGTDRRQYVRCATTLDGFVEISASSPLQVLPAAANIIKVRDTR